MTRHIEQVRNGMGAEGGRDTISALRLSEEKFAKVFRSSPDWIAITTLSDGRFVEVNDAFLWITGYSREEVLGKPSSELRLWVDPQERLNMVEELREKGIIRNHEVRFRMKSGEIRTMLRSAELIDLEGVECMISVTRDITDRKRAEEEIRSLNYELEQRIAELTEANKELDAFNASVSHDLRSPLMVIGGFTKIVLREHADCLDLKGVEMLQTIQKSVGKMENLINDLLAFSRSGRKQLNVARVDMRDLAQSVFDDLSATVPDRKVKFDVGDILPADVDRSLMRQVFANLIANAIKFTRHREVAVIEVRSRVEGDHIVYSVRDNGVGFDMQSSDRLFNVFQRLHRSEEFEGTGLGLSIVHRIVSRHGGRAWAEGKVGGGATFHFSVLRGG
ncbi:MAG: sensor histidine kinase [Chloroflexota bacterium]